MDVCALELASSMIERDNAPELNPISIIPSEFISRLGKEIDNEESMLYWDRRISIRYSARR